MNLGNTSLKYISKRYIPFCRKSILKTKKTNQNHNEVKDLIYILSFISRASFLHQKNINNNTKVLSNRTILSY